MVVTFIRTYLSIVFLFAIVGISCHVQAQTYEVELVKVGKSTEQVFASDCYDHKLFFCSNAKAKKAKHVVNEDDSRFLNLYQITLDDSYQLIKKVKPQILSENINSKLNEGPIFFNKNTGEAYFSSNLKTDSTALSLVLYYSKYDNRDKTFSPRQRMILDLGDGNYSNPTISPDGKKIVFSFTNLTDTTSNIYLAEKNENGWSKPKKIESICSDYSESFPRWFDNTLYFVSTRPGGFGGLDIYKSSYFDGKFQAPALMPEPINSAYDDFLFFHVTNTVGFFSSNRGQKSDKIYRFELDIPTTSNFVESDVQFCYTVQDEEILDENEYEYIWNFGDGSEKEGAIVKHCYQDTGVYELSCNLLDKATNKVENNIINAVIEVVAKYPLIDITPSSNGISKVSLNQDWSRRTYDSHYWLMNGDIIDTKTFVINSSVSKPIEIKAVLWDSKNPDEVIGIVKTIEPKQ